MQPQTTPTGPEPAGLTTEQAERLRVQYGLNAVAEVHPSALRALAGKFWAPVPWMLEAAVVLEILLHKTVEGAVIAGLLVFNALLSFVQENNAQRALALLRRRLTIQARVRRDGTWQRLPAEHLVPGDLIYLRVGDMVPADARIIGGNALIDHSAVTGESTPTDASAGNLAYTGGVIKRGEATALVAATGRNTYFGKTAELVQQARAAGHLQQMIFTIVKYLAALDVLLASLVLAYGLNAGMKAIDVIPFCLILLVASIPVALPATFTLASAIGTRELAQRGVLVSRLSAIEEAAAMDTLATDKTGTLTRNELSLASVAPIAPYSEADVLRYAMLASDEATQDPIDLAIFAAARSRAIGASEYSVEKFSPFDPSTKRSEALVKRVQEQVRIVKGAPATIAALAKAPDSKAAEDLASRGYRVLAVAAGSGEALSMTGFLALLDPPREDSARLIANLRSLGVRVLMITGDAPATAQTVASQVGITGPTCPSERIRIDARAAAAACDIFAGVFPEDKFRIVQALQQTGHVVGMTGDGVNDAPALKQAEVGVAVANATDVAKAAASIVLTNPGLTDIVSAVETSRRIYQRMLTYTLNKIIKTIEIALFLSLGVIFTHALVVTPLLIVLLLFTNDFVTMSIATDRVSFSKQPDRWNIRALAAIATPLAVLLVAFLFGVLFAGRALFSLSAGQLQTLAFLALVFGGQGTVYLVRERGRFWRSRPSHWMLSASFTDFVVVGFLATYGILMAPVPVLPVAALFGACLVYLFIVDFLKIAIFRRFRVA